MILKRAVVVLSLLSASVAFADSAKIAGAKAATPSQAADSGLGPVVRADETTTRAGVCPEAKRGDVCHMDQAEADRYCQAQGSRLPTARELALEAQRLGAKGIIEPETYYDGGLSVNEKADYSPIFKLGTQGYSADFQGTSVVDFFFDRQGYKRPRGDLGQYWFWSSSVHPDITNSVYVLDGRDGHLGGEHRDDKVQNFAVRCR